jgi:hypothetical protein
LNRRTAGRWAFPGPRKPVQSLTTTTPKTPSQPKTSGNLNRRTAGRWAFPGPWKPVQSLTTTTPKTPSQPKTSGNLNRRTAGRWAIPLQIAATRSLPTGPSRVHKQPTHGISLAPGRRVCIVASLPVARAIVQHRKFSGRAARNRSLGGLELGLQTLSSMSGHPQSPRLAPGGFYATPHAGSGFRRGGMPEWARNAFP